MIEPENQWRTFELPDYQIFIARNQVENISVDIFKTIRLYIKVFLLENYILRIGKFMFEHRDQDLRAHCLFVRKSNFWNKDQFRIPFHPIRSPRQDTAFD